MNSSKAGIVSKSALLSGALALFVFPLGAGWEDVNPPRRYKGAAAEAPKITVDGAPRQSGGAALAPAPAPMPAAQSAVPSPVPAAPMAPALSATPTPAPVAHSAAPVQDAPVRSHASTHMHRPHDFYIPFLDSPRESKAWYSLHYFGKAETLPGCEISFAELNVRYSFLEARNFLGADAKLSLNPKIVALTDDGGFDILPSMLLELPVEGSMVWRFVNGWSFEAACAPGLYGDIGAMGASVAFPFRGVFYYSLNPSFAFRGGCEVRPGWDYLLKPVAGLSWSPGEVFYLEFGVPRTLLGARLGPVTVFGKVDWVNLSYAMDGGEGKPDELALNEWRLSAGVSADFGDDRIFGLEIGKTIERELKAHGSEGESTLPVDDAVFFGLSFGSRF